MQKITTFLTFEDRAEEAVELYTSIFPNSQVLTRQYYGDAGPGATGSLMTAAFELDGQEFVALNGGASFSFSEGISLFVGCETQEEVDRLWEQLSDGGEAGPCGWLKDRFGDDDSATSQRVMEAMLRMGKIEIDGLERAAAAA